MHPNSVEIAIEKYCTKGVVIDTNLLLVYAVGCHDPRWIEKFSRTHSYSADDFSLLSKFVSRFSVVVSTPNILTEVSNLLGQLPGGVKPSCFEELRKQILLLNEEFLPSRDASSSKHFVRFGLTDSAIMGVSKNRYLVLTDDLKLAFLLEKFGFDVLNFNHLRAPRWMPGGG
jgi:hypothetical protein